MDYKDQITHHMQIDTSSAYAVQGATIALLGDIAFMMNDLLQSVQPGQQAPVVIDNPYIEQDVNTLTCTMGNWSGEPTDYTYEWKADGIFKGTGTPYTLVPEDTGQTFVCTVTATNSAGSSSATSNEVIPA